MSNKPADGHSPSEFYKFVVASALFLLSGEMFVLAVPLIVLGLGYSPIVAGWASFAGFCAATAGRMLLGPVVERHDKKRILLLSGYGRSLVLLLFLSAVMTMRREFLYIMIPICGVFGLLGVLTEAAEPAVLKMLLPSGGQVRRISQYEIRTRTVQLAGPVICGGLLAVSIYASIGAILLASVVSTLILAQVTIGGATGGEQAGRPSYAGSAITWLRGQRLLLVMVVLTTINNFLHPILYLSILYQMKQVGLGDDHVGMVLSGLGVGGIVGSLMSPVLSTRLSLRQTVILVNVCRVFVFWGFVVAETPVQLFGFFVLKAVLGGTWNVCYNVYAINEMPMQVISRVSALSGLIIRSGTALGSAVAGYCISFLGVTPTLRYLVGLTMVMLLCSLPYKSLYPAKAKEPMPL